MNCREYFMAIRGAYESYDAISKSHEGRAYASFWSEYRPITFTLNVRATTQHTFECPHERSEICGEVARTLKWK